MNIYSFINYTRTYSNHSRFGAHQRQDRRRRKEQRREKWKKKRSETKRAKPRTPTPAIDALIGNEEHTGEKKRDKERNMEWVSNLATLDPSITFYDPQGSYTHTHTHTYNIQLWL